MKLSQKLATSLGLSEYESRVYIALQNNGPLHVQNLAKFASLPRTAVYPPLNSLLLKGYASQSVFGKRKYYSALPVEDLRDIFIEKRNLIEESIVELSESRKIKSNVAQLESNFFIGEQGIKSAGLVFLNETKDKTWYSFENLTKTSDTVGFDFENFYIKERVKRGIKSKMILSMTEESPGIRAVLRQDKEQLRETVVLSPHEYPFDTTVVITKGLILMINPNESKFALLIRNQHLANTFIQLHRCIWDRYR